MCPAVAAGTLVASPTLSPGERHVPDAPHPRGAGPPPHHRRRLRRAVHRPERQRVRGGHAGTPGEPGPRGDSGISGWEYLVAGQAVEANQVRSWHVDCPAGKKALGGGVATAATGNAKGYIQIAESAPAGAATGWAATVYNRVSPGGPTFTNYVWVICASVSA